MAQEQCKDIFVCPNPTRAIRAIRVEDMAWYGEMHSDGHKLYVVATLAALHAAVRQVRAEIDQIAKLDRDQIKETELEIVTRQLINMCKAGWKPEQTSVGA